jgi:hypothetical protein
MLKYIVKSSDEVLAVLKKSEVIKASRLVVQHIVSTLVS